MSKYINAEVIGNLGIITLTRSKALNALTTDMCQAMTDTLLKWDEDENVGAVVVRAETAKAFCAGGDVVMLHESGKADGKAAETFWRTEYALNELIQRYVKPYIAMIDGFVMGGGVGLSIMARHRIAGDQTLFSMPETAIGYFPDVGGTYFLPRLGHSIGMWLALTGAKLDTAQVCELGIANAYVPSARHEALITALGKAELNGSDKPVLDVLEKFVKQPPKAPDLNPSMAAFHGESVPVILDLLEMDGSEWALEQIKILSERSPIALCVTHEALMRGRQLIFREAMTEELNISMNFLAVDDFYEGIRAMLIDKDKKPKWSHDSVRDIKIGEITKMFKKTAKPPLKFLI